MSLGSNSEIGISCPGFPLPMPFNSSVLCRLAVMPCAGTVKLWFPKNMKIVQDSETAPTHPGFFGWPELFFVVG